MRERLGVRRSAAAIGLTALIVGIAAMASPWARAGVGRPAAPPGYHIVHATFDASFATGEGKVLCGRGKVVLGGGYELHSVQGTDPFAVLSSAPSTPTGAGWKVGWDNVGGGAVSATVDVYAVCATS